MSDRETIVMAKVVGSTYGDVVDPTPPAPPAAGELPTSEGLELPTGPGVWGRKDENWLIVTRYRERGMPLRFAGFTDPKCMNGSTFLELGYVEDLPRGRWHKLTASDERELQSLREELAHMRTTDAVQDRQALLENVESLTARLAEVEGERDRLNGILLRIAAHVTPIRDADNEQQHVNDMADTMGRIDELDNIVNDRVCDLECEAAQADERAIAAEARVRELEAALESKSCQKCDADGYWYHTTKLAKAELAAALEREKGVLADNIALVAVLQDVNLLFACGTSYIPAHMTESGSPSFSLHGPTPEQFHAVAQRVRVAAESEHPSDGIVSEREKGLREALESRESRQKRVLEWAVSSFGQIAANRDERAARLAEEAIEVAQTEGVPVEIIHRIADRVYSRPPGEIGREIGGVAITLDALAENLGRNVLVDGDVELQRVLSKPKEWWAKKHGEKVAAGTADLTPSPAPSPKPQAPSPEPQEANHG